MEHKNFSLTKRKLQDTSAGNFVLAGFGFMIFWYVLFAYILPLFVDFFSNATIAFLETVVHPIGSVVPLILFGYAFFVWIAKKFNSKDKDKDTDRGNDTMGVVKKLLKLSLFRRQETKDKWWHRLALVLIYGSTIVGAIFLGSLLVTEEADNWARYSYTAYSFEEGYPTAKGREMDCKFSATSLGDLPLVFSHCGDLSTGSEFLEKYFRARGTYDRLVELRKGPENLVKLDLTALKRNYIPIAERPGYKRTKSDIEIMVQLVKSGELEDVKVKRVMSFEYATFLGNWSLYLLLVFGWLIFWESIVYRTLLYVVYGKKN